MSRPIKRRTQSTALWIAVAALVIGGGAGWPQIDPTGEHFFVVPGQQPAPVVMTPLPPPPVTTIPAAPGTTVIPAAPPAIIASPAPIVPPPPPPISVAPLGNTIAPPVYPDAGIPTVPAGTVMPPPTLPPGAAPVGVAPPAVAVPVVAIGRDHMQVSPVQLMAPVGTQVIVKANVVTAANLWLLDQRVEWDVPRDGPGQIAEVSGGGYDSFRWPWDQPRRIDNWSAVSITPRSGYLLQRGTADPRDDIAIQAGESWVSVTSPVEGMTTVTASSPAIADREFNRAAATIYWLDAQWLFPPSACEEAGKPHVLTTTVSRRTTGAPVAGWIVHYEAVSTGASLGTSGAVDATTDANGRASVEISPSDPNGGTATISVVIVRPPQAVGGVGPNVEVGRALTMITWVGSGSGATAGATTGPPPMTSPSAAPATPAPTYGAPGNRYEPRPSLPSTSQPGSSISPAPAGKPDLQIEVRRISAQQVNVGDIAKFELVVTNRGNAAARGIRIRDRFDAGLRHPKAEPNSNAVDYNEMRDLQPGQSATVPLTFNVLTTGEQCHQVTVSATDSNTATGSGCITAVAPVQPVTKPTLEVTVVGPTQSRVGELAKFRVTVKNTGASPAANVDIFAAFDGAFDPHKPEESSELMRDGRIRWHIDRIDPTEARVFNLQAVCTSASPRACNHITVTGDGGVNKNTDACVEILPFGQAPGAPANPAAGVPASNLRLSVISSANPARVGAPLTIFAYVENTGQKPEQNVEVRILIPQEMTPVETQIQPAGTFTIIAQRELRFTAIPEVAPGQKREIIIPVTVDKPGSSQVSAQLHAPSLSTDLTAQSTLINVMP